MFGPLDGGTSRCKKGRTGTQRQATDVPEPRCVIPGDLASVPKFSSVETCYSVVLCHKGNQLFVTYEEGIMSEDPKELKLPDPEVREGIRNMTSSLQEQMANLAAMNVAILKRLEDIQGATTQTQINQSRFSLDHERLLNSVDSLLGTVKHSAQGLSLQMRDLRTTLKKDDESE